MPQIPSQVMTSETNSIQFSANISRCRLQREGNLHFQPSMVYSDSDILERVFQRVGICSFRVICILVLFYFLGRLNLNESLWLKNKIEI